MPVKRINLPSKGESSKRALFEHRSQESKGRVGAALKNPEVSHKTSSVQLGSSLSTLKDMSSFEWAMKYQENNRRVILYLGKTTRTCVVSRGHMFSYGKMLEVDYQDEDSQA